MICEREVQAARKFRDARNNIFLHPQSPSSFIFRDSLIAVFCEQAGNRGALIIYYTVWGGGVPYYSCSIRGPKTLF